MSRIECLQCALLKRNTFLLLFYPFPTCRRRVCPFIVFISGRELIQFGVRAAFVGFPDETVNGFEKEDIGEEMEKDVCCDASDACAYVECTGTMVWIGCRCV